MDKAKKTAKSLDLPMIVNQPVKIKLSNGKTAQTVPESIDRVEYSRGVMYVSFSTGNSFYERVPVRIKEVKNYMDGEVIERGAMIKTTFYPVQVASIEQILEDKIIIRDMSNNVFATAIFME